MYKNDLTGRTFGHLTVLGYNEEISLQKGRSHWDVECDCPDHTRFIVIGSNLITGNTTKCKYCKAQSLVGQKFNRLTVIAREIKNNKTMWKCQCECGNIIVVRGDSLKSGHTKSCGCLQKEKVAQLNFKDITGQKFGRLTVTRRSNNKDTSGNYYWFCDCECGTKNHEVSGHHLKAGRISSCGCLRSKGEEKIAALLTENNIPFLKEYCISDLILSTGGHPKFDFAILNSDNSVAYFIEYQGEQHFNARGSIFTEEKVEIIQQRDLEKKQYCEYNNIPLIYILYTDFDTFSIKDLYFPELLK